MSTRREVPAARVGLVVTVGWDNPLGTFFGQVQRVSRAGKPGRTLLWVGGEAQECPRAEDLVDPLAPYARLSAGMVERLRADRALDLDRGPSALQRALGGRFIER